MKLIILHYEKLETRGYTGSHKFADIKDDDFKVNEMLINTF